MSGNAMEEGLILQIHNPSHLDPSRIGFLAGALSGFVSLGGITVVLPNLPRILAVYMALAVVAAVGSLVTRRISAKRQQQKVDAMIAARAMQQAETDRQISEMNRGPA